MLCRSELKRLRTVIIITIITWDMSRYYMSCSGCRDPGRVGLITPEDISERLMVVRPSNIILILILILRATAVRMYMFCDRWGLWEGRQ